MAKMSREGSDFETGEGELQRGRGQRGLGHQAELRGALALGCLGKGMEPKLGKKNKTKTVMVFESR